MPTGAQAGLEDFTATNWFGIAAPQGTPQAIVDRMQAEVAKASAPPDLARRFADQGVDVGVMAPADFQACVRSQVEEWGEVITAAGVQGE
ncbi:tripartite tricarboxylate transporter substrate-binding protein [Variovorax sp. PvP013]|uniref:tripartite tricarboxylate transporter substrate-binding protein n=1 Tax=Variovorax sp. PvP013 TaxID=3156435 RepID=UPI003D1E0E59